MSSKLKGELEAAIRNEYVHGYTDATGVGGFYPDFMDGLIE